MGNRTRGGALAAAFLALAAAACQTTQVPSVPDFERRYGELAGQLSESTFEDQSTSAEQAKLAELASEATAAAEQELDPNSATMFWRLAALSAWQGGAAGNAQLEGIVAGGTAACQRVAPPDFGAPGNCLTIYMVPIRADYDRTKANVLALQAKPKPPAAADGAQIVAWFDGLERDFQKASALGRRFSASRIDPMQLQAVGSDMKKIACLARADLELLGQAQGKDAAAVAPFAARLETLRGGLDPELRDAPCPTR